MIRRLLFAALAVGPLVGLAGCRHHRCCSSPDRAPQPYLPPPPAGSPFLGPNPNAIPPTQVPVTPGPSPFLGPQPGPGPSPGPLPVPDVVPRQGNFGPPSPAPNNAGPAQELILPDPLPNSPSSRSNYPDPLAGPPFLGPPVSPKPSSAEPPVSRPLPQPGPTVSPKTAAAPTTGLPGYTRLKDGVATGRKPALEGFDSLKQSGFRTVAYLHPAGADVSAARDVVEKRGLTFVAVETTPETLSAALTQVNQLVADKAGQPVYVYDDDGLRTGAVWYLHFRTVDAQAAEPARIRARSIGLTDQTEEGRAFWVAIQQVLANR